MSARTKGRAGGLRWGWVARIPWGPGDWPPWGGHVRVGRVGGRGTRGQVERHVRGGGARVTEKRLWVLGTT